MIRRWLYNARYQYYLHLCKYGYSPALISKPLSNYLFPNRVIMCVIGFLFDIIRLFEFIFTNRIHFLPYSDSFLLIAVGFKHPTAFPYAYGVSR